MSADRLTGSRIRERRMSLGMKQAELARRAHMSPSYLNLIEHNRRRIAGKLLIDVANVLGVEPSQLSEGAEAALLTSLHQAASRFEQAGAETVRAEEFAGRFPGWARVIAAQQDRIGTLEQTVASLSDRIAYDPQLAEALHNILDAITAVRSTSSILASGEDLEPEWRARFSRNINEDARRLAEGSQSLVKYLDASSTPRDDAALTVQDEVQTWLDQAQHRFESLHDPRLAASQAALDAQTEALLAGEGAPSLSDAARQEARAVLERYAADAAALPDEALHAALTEIGLRPGDLASALAQPVARIMRRLATLPPDDVAPFCSMPSPNGLGLATCSAAGTIAYRKAIPGFHLPRLTPGCPDWPLYQALTHPGVAVHRLVQARAPDVTHFDCYAYAYPTGAVRFDAPTRVEAIMLLVPTAARPGAAPSGCGECRYCSQF